VSSQKILIYFIFKFDKLLDLYHKLMKILLQSMKKRSTTNNPDIPLKGSAVVTFSAVPGLWFTLDI